MHLVFVCVQIEKFIVHYEISAPTFFAFLCTYIHGKLTLKKLRYDILGEFT